MEAAQRQWRPPPLAKRWEAKLRATRAKLLKLADPTLPMWERIKRDERRAQDGTFVSPVGDDGSAAHTQQCS